MFKRMIGLALLTSSVSAHAGAFDWMYAAFNKNARWADEGKVAKDMPDLEIDPQTARCVVDANHKVSLRDRGQTLYNFAPHGTDAISQKIYLLCGQAIIRAQRNTPPGQLTKIPWVQFVNDRQWWDKNPNAPMTAQDSEITTEGSPFSKTATLLSINGIPAFQLSHKTFKTDVKIETAKRDRDYFCTAFGGCQAEAPAASVTAAAATSAN